MIHISPPQKSRRAQIRLVYARAVSASIFAACVLIGCVQQAPAPRIVVTPEPEPEPVYSAPPARLDDAELARRYVADILYQGMRALASDRLMTPPEDSALHHFSRAMALDPDNQIAKDGMRDIAGRYLQLADLAGRQGQFNNAENFMRRAAQVDNNHPNLEQASRRLQVERERTHSVTTLSARDVIARQPSVVSQLQELALVIADANAFVLITAPNDELGRWMYAQIQDSLSDYRVRGDIEIGEQPSVRLVLASGSGT
jgi:tetratricopeptide (TPR) repeat protein